MKQKSFSKEQAIQLEGKFAEEVEKCTSTESIVREAQLMDKWCIRKIREYSKYDESQVDRVKRLRDVCTAIASKRVKKVKDYGSVKEEAFKQHIHWSKERESAVEDCLKVLNSDLYHYSSKDFLKQKDIILSILNSSTSVERIYYCLRWKDGIRVLGERLYETEIPVTTSEDDIKLVAPLPETVDEIMDVISVVDDNDADGLYMTKDGRQKSWEHMTFAERFDQLFKILELRFLNIRNASSIENLIYYWGNVLRIYELYTTGKFKDETLSDDKFIMDFGKDKEKLEEWFYDTVFSNFAIGCISVSKNTPSETKAIAATYEKVRLEYGCDLTWSEMLEKYAEHEKKKDASYAFKSVPF